MLQANPLRFAAAVAGLQIGHRHQVSGRVEEGHLHHAAAACALTLQQRLQDADDGVHAGRGVAQRDTELFI